MKKIALASGVLALGTSAIAAVPVPVLSYLGDMGADAVTVLGVTLAAVVAIFALKMIHRSLT